MAQFVAKSTLAAYYRCLNQFQFTDAALIMKASLLDESLLSAIEFLISPLLLFAAAEHEYYSMRFLSRDQIGGRGLVEVYDSVLEELRQIELVLRTVTAYPSTREELNEANQLIRTLGPIQVICRVRKFLVEIYASFSNISLPNSSSTPSASSPSFSSLLSSDESRSTSPPPDFIQLRSICDRVQAIIYEDLRLPLTALLRDLILHELHTVSFLCQCSIFSCRGKGAAALEKLYRAKQEFDILIALAPIDTLPLFTTLKSHLDRTALKFSLLCAAYLNAPLPFSSTYTASSPSILIAPTSSRIRKQPPTKVEGDSLLSVKGLVARLQHCGFTYICFYPLLLFPYKSHPHPSSRNKEALAAMCYLHYQQGLIRKLPMEHEANVNAIIRTNQQALSQSVTGPILKRVGGHTYGGILVEKTVFAVVIHENTDRVAACDGEEEALASDALETYQQHLLSLLRDLQDAFRLDKPI